ncbi:MAG: peptidase family protein [Frankiales bacterium]|nr:peptidase family protein [Frankiales bacterium]
MMRRRRQGLTYARGMPHIAVVTLDGFNEIDSFVASYMLSRVDRPDWSVSIASPTPQVTSMNGVTVQSQMSLEDLPDADAVLVGSGSKTRQYATDAAFLASMQLDPTRQVIGSQCSGALLLAKLGLLDGVPVCTDLISKPWVVEAGANVVDQPFFAVGNVATAGGCLSSQYLAAWMIARLADLDTARAALFYVAPVGEKDEYVDRALGHVRAFLPMAATGV